MSVVQSGVKERALSRLLLLGPGRGESFRGGYVVLVACGAAARAAHASADALVVVVKVAFVRWSEGLRRWSEHDYKRLG